MKDLRGQTSTELLASGGETVTVISAGRDVEQGARAMLILAEGLFRLDVVPFDDMVHALVRNLSTTPKVEMRLGDAGGGVNLFSGPQEFALPSSSRLTGEIVLIDEGGEERAAATIMVGSVCHLERGLTSFTAQATLS